MGLGRVIWTGCLGMCCLIPMAWISFTFLDLTAAVSNGIFIDLGPALDAVLQNFLPGALGAILPVLIGGLLGIVMLLFFPLHWALYYRPDDIVMAIAIILPWILVGTITSALFCKKAKQGFDTGLAVGLGYAIGVSILVLALDAFVGSGLGFSITEILNGLFTGLTELPFYGALFLSCIEGGLIGGIFGALIGSLKYKPGEEKVKGKKSKKAKTADSGAVFDEPTLGSVSESICKNCGTALGKGDTFCPNCGKSN